jgi:hypothetical protein
MISGFHKKETVEAHTQAKTHNLFGVFGVDVDSHEQCCAAPLGQCC